MSAKIHPTAIVEEGVDLDSDVSVGAYTQIGPRVEVGSGTSIGPHSVIECNTRIGCACSIGVGCVLGGDPQDRKYKGEETWLEIGDKTQLRDYTTVNRGSAAREMTSIGRECLLMTYVHVAHDCVLEDGVIIANGVQLAGHIHIGARAYIGGLTPVHQFVRIGRHAFIGGGSRLPQDVPPFTRAAGNPLKLYGINTLGLTRAGFSEETRVTLKHAYRLLFNSALLRKDAADMLIRKHSDVPEVCELIDFVVGSERGILA
jgi:UDP-N-acetylglucosamine acyltransferase